MQYRERCYDKAQPEQKSFIDKYPGFVYLVVLAVQIVMIPVLIGQWALFAGPDVTFNSNLHGVILWVGIITNLALHPLVVYYFARKGVFED
jgi:hypothetical protein